MAPKFKFQEGEKVLCFHGPLLYEAKCIKAQSKEKQVKYFIHYNGWNKNWDEWVPENRVLKFNEANLQKQKELEKTHLKNRKTKPVKVPNKAEKERASTPSQEKQSKQKSAPSTPSSQHEQSSSEGQRKKRSRADPHMESETFLTRVAIKIVMPEDLKPWLVDDWDLITRQKKLFDLPAKKNVDQILQEYVQYKSENKGLSPNRESTITEIANGIKEYFNATLGSQLLYKFERPQYSEILTEHPETPMSQIYGSIHLLRLFVKLGNMLAYTPLDEKSVQLLLTHIHDFLKYLSNNASTLFDLNDYVVASPEYHRKAI